MSQTMRNLATNRRFAIPLIVLLALCLIGLLLLGVVLVSSRNKPVAEATATATLQPTQTSVSTTIPTATAQPTAKPTNTLVPVGTPVSVGTATLPPVVEATSTAGATPGTGEQPTTTPPDDDELADTGVGWGLILASGVGLALLFIAARRLRLTS